MTDEDDETAAEETEEPEEPEGFQNGDFLRIEYTARTVESDQLVDTTDEDVAVEEGVDTDQQEFGPRTIVLGEGHVFEAVDEALLGGEVGDSGTVTVPAAEAFGEYDPEEVRTISADKIGEDDRYPGAPVQIDGERGRVETIVGGRARVDFNHPLAGEDIEYEYEVLEAVEDRTERARGLLGMYVDVDPDLWIQTDEVEEEVTVEVDDEESEADDDEESEPEYRTETELVEKETLYVEATPQMTMNQQWLFSKQQVARELMNRLDLDRVIVQETIDYSGGGGMMGGMGMPGMGGGDVDLGDAEVDAEEIVEELGEE
jgi:FKBP-type peptidyl-prolyl cis-trans isomerase SlyD